MSADHSPERLLPHPYSGPRRRRAGRLGCRWSTDTYDTDTTQDVRYEFNDFGYRGPAYDEDAAFTVFIFGESDAFGLGVTFEETWAYRVALAVATERGVEPADMCVMNFADCGASGTYIARQVATQCGRVQPDLALINWADDGRMEGFSKDSSYLIGPWLRDQEAQAAATEGQQSDEAREFLRTAQAFLAFSSPEQALYQGLRDLLLVQNTLQAHGIRAAACSRHVGRYITGSAPSRSALEELKRCVDPNFLMGSSTDEIAGEDLTADGIHFAATAHGRIAERMVAFVREGASPAAYPGLARWERVTHSVRSYYSNLPVHYGAGDKAASETIRSPFIQTAYPDLAAYLRQSMDRGASVPLGALEVGCGAGWLAHGVALHYGAKVVGLDLSGAAIAQAQTLGEAIGTESRTTFLQQDILSFADPGAFDLAISIGALHHTAGPRAAFERMVQSLHGGGHIYLGLYHAPGRRAFLGEFQRLIREEGTEAAFDRFRSLDGVRGQDEELARSSFHEQLMHPHESQHTLGEVLGWFEEFDIELVSTSINRFAPLPAMAELLELESGYAEVSRRALFEEGRFFPGFFTAFGRRRAPTAGA